MRLSLSEQIFSKKLLTQITFAGMMSLGIISSAFAITSSDFSNLCPYVAGISPPTGGNNPPGSNNPSGGNNPPGSNTPSCTGVDSDADGFPDACDNCPTIPNADQTDTGNLKIGDACRPGVSGGVGCTIGTNGSAGQGFPRWYAFALLLGVISMLFLRKRFSQSTHAAR